MVVSLGHHGCVYSRMAVRQKIQGAVQLTMRPKAPTNAVRASNMIYSLYGASSRPLGTAILPRPDLHLVRLQQAGAAPWYASSS